jgi:hypothetical protein
MSSTLSPEGDPAMPTAKDSQRPHTHSWSRKDKAVYCVDCSLHFTERIAELEQQVAKLERWVQGAKQRIAIDAIALP